MERKSAAKKSVAPKAPKPKTVPPAAPSRAPPPKPALSRPSTPAAKPAAAQPARDFTDLLADLNQVVGRERAYNPLRKTLYTPDELMAGYDPAVPDSASTTASSAHRKFGHNDGRRPTLPEALIQRVHDVSIDSASARLPRLRPGRPLSHPEDRGHHGRPRESDAALKTIVKTARDGR